MVHIQISSLVYYTVFFWANKLKSGIVTKNTIEMQNGSVNSFCEY